MPLYACSNPECKTVENTALGDFWEHQDAPHCSECATGKWHGEFPKERADNGTWEPDPKHSRFLRRKKARPND